jgi:putative intracellular protease/amidase
MLRLDPKAIDFVRHFVRSDKPVAAICHVHGRLLTLAVPKVRK